MTKWMLAAIASLPFVLRLHGEEPKMSAERAFEEGVRLNGEKKPSEAALQFGLAVTLADKPTLRAKAQNQIGALLKDAKKFDEARAVFEKTLAMADVEKTTRGEAQYLISHSWIDSGNWARAYDEWIKLLDFEEALWPYAKSETWMVAGSGLVEKKKYAEARVVLLKCIGFKEGEAWHKTDAQFTLARSYFEEGQMPKAKEEFDKFLAMNSNNGGQKQKAAEYLQKIKGAGAAK